MVSGEQPLLPLTGVPSQTNPQAQASLMLWLAPSHTPAAPAGRRPTHTLSTLTACTHTVDGKPQMDLREAVRTEHIETLWYGDEVPVGMGG